MSRRQRFSSNCTPLLGFMRKLGSTLREFGTYYLRGHIWSFTEVAGRGRFQIEKNMNPYLWISTSLLNLMPCS